MSPQPTIVRGPGDALVPKVPLSYVECWERVKDICLRHLIHHADTGLDSLGDLKAKMAFGDISLLTLVYMKASRLVPLLWLETTRPMGEDERAHFDEELEDLINYAVLLRAGRLPTEYRD